MSFATALSAPQRSVELSGALGAAQAGDYFTDTYSFSNPTMNGKYDTGGVILRTVLNFTGVTTAAKVVTKVFAKPNTDAQSAQAQTIAQEQSALEAQARKSTWDVVTPLILLTGGFLVVAVLLGTAATKGAHR